MSTKEERKELKSNDERTNSFEPIMSYGQLPAHIRFDWNKWLSNLVYNSNGIIKQAIALQTSMEDVEQYGPVLGQVNFEQVFVSDILNIIQLIAAKKLQNHILDLSENQYIITSVHDHSFCGRILNQTNEKKDGGVVIIRCPHVTLITAYEAPSQAWKAVPYVEDFVKDISVL